MPRQSNSLEDKERSSVIQSLKKLGLRFDSKKELISPEDDIFFFLLDEPLTPIDRDTELHHASKALKDRWSVVDRFVDRLARIPRLHNTAEDDNTCYGTFTCAVYGPWGSGKTSFLRLVQQAIRTESPGTITVWFEPWRYENEENLIVPLIVEMVATLHQQALVSIDETRESSGQIVSRIRQGGDDTRIKRAAAAKAAQRLVGRVARDAFRAAGKVMASHLGGIDPAKVGEEFLSRYAEEVIRIDEESYQVRIVESEVEAFRRDFRRLLSMVKSIQDQYEQEDGVETLPPLVILIDDLDRCSPPQVRRLLESIKVFLNVPDVFYILAIDETQILRAMSKPYLEYFSESAGREYKARALSKRYLEKFFQHSIRIGDQIEDDVDGVDDAERRRLKKRIWESVCLTLVRRAIQGEYYPTEGLEYEILKTVSRVYDSAAKGNPRLLKSLARWIYFNYPGHRQTGVKREQGLKEIPYLFAEQVFASNFGSVWVNEISGVPQEPRSMFYKACAWLVGEPAMRPNEISGAQIAVRLDRVFRRMVVDPIRSMDFPSSSPPAVSPHRLSKDSTDEEFDVAAEEILAGTASEYGEMDPRLAADLLRKFPTMFREVHKMVDRQEQKAIHGLQIVMQVLSSPEIDMKGVKFRK